MSKNTWSPAIKVDVEGTQRILKEIGGKAADIRSQEKVLQQLSEATKGCWQGVSGDALRERLTELIQEQRAIARDLENDTQAMSSTIQQLADEDANLAAVISGTTPRKNTSQGGKAPVQKAEDWFSDSRGQSGGGRRDSDDSKNIIQAAGDWLSDLFDRDGHSGGGRSDGGKDIFGAAEDWLGGKNSGGRKG